ncbi:hypothetical protein L596_015239 [Steinernema carpocapsae]|uniref:Uncharacterized protein n=1 Tax=Steinernema carpocapsae TaxID=34508 RepID=A0A4U5NFA0_STECR|nr:hypothetical protein L596_015239 [Steinernema carpocapsae]
MNPSPGKEIMRQESEKEIEESGLGDDKEMKRWTSFVRRPLVRTQNATLRADSRVLETVLKPCGGQKRLKD